MDDPGTLRLMVTKARLLTAEEFLHLPDDGMCHELVRGEVRTSPPPAPEHGEVAFELGFRIGAHVRLHGLGRLYGAETGWLIGRNPDTVRAADFAFVAAGRLPPGPSPGTYVELTPDLVAEVASPGDRPRDIRQQVRGWLDAGACRVLVLYPRRRSMAVRRPGRREELLGPDDVFDGEHVLPGFQVRVGDLFPG